MVRDVTLLATLLGVRGGLAMPGDGKSALPVRPALRCRKPKGIAAKRSGGHPYSACMGIILDVVFQLVIYRAVHPGVAVLIRPILICTPYALSKAVTTRLERWLRGICIIPF